MKNVLWFSRHKMDAEQITSLEKKIGKFELTQIDKTIKSASEIAAEIVNADVVAVVSPPDLLSEFSILCGNKPLIFSESERILIKSEDGSESKVVFKFKRWVRINKFIYETCTFCD